MTAVGTKVFASEYNAIQAAISTVLGTGAGASGYGQTVLSSQVSTSSSITVAQWANLRADLLKAYLHQGTPGDLPLPSVPQKSSLPYTIVTYSDYNRYLDLSNVITANAGVAPPAGQATLQTFSTGSYTSTWNGQLTHSVVLTFATANQARFYFNSGGNIQFSASLINYPGYPGYGSQSASYAKNSDWNMLLNNMGTTTFGRNSTVNSGNGTGQTILSAVGYFQLTTGEQNIYRKTTSSASYTPNQYDLYANVDATGAVITFNIRFKDLSTTSGTGFGATDENVEGSLTSLIQGYYASGSYVAATPPATTAVFAGGVVVAPPPPPVTTPPVTTPPVVVYNEVVTAPASVQVGTSFSVSISGGAPSTTYNFTALSLGSNTIDYSSNGTLNSSGSASVTIPVVNPITNNTIQSSPGDWRYTFVFTGSSNTRIVTVTATAVPPNPSYGAFTATPNPAVDLQYVTLSVTVYNVIAGQTWSMTAAHPLNSVYAQTGGTFTGSGTQTITQSNFFIFRDFAAPFTTYFKHQTLPTIQGPTITLYVAPVVTPPSYGAYGWSPVGPVNVGTSATFSAVANNAIGDIYGIGIGLFDSTTTVTGVITTNPQTLSRTITAAYDAAYPYYNGIFVLSSLSPNTRNVLLTVTAPAAPPPPTPTYSVTGSSSVNEGGTVSVSVTSTNVPNGTSLYWQLTSTITGLTPEADANDFGSTSGSFVINSNAGSFGVGVTADNLTEGTEFRAVRVYSDSGLSNQIGYVVFSISDTSTTPVVYNETVTGPSTVTVGYANFNIALAGGAPNTGFSWTGSTTGSGTLNASGSATVPFGAGAAAGSYSYTITFAATGHVITYSITVVAAASYGAYGWSPAGPVANGTSATFSVTVLNAVGLGYAISTINNGVQGPTTSGTVTTNPQTFSQTISVIYNSGINPYGSFFLSGQSGAVSSEIVVTAPAPPYVPPPPPPPPPPSIAMASYTASPNPASNGATITVTATVNNVTAGADWALQAIGTPSVIALNIGGTHASSGTQTVSATFTFNSSQAPYSTWYNQFAPVPYQYAGPIVTVAPLNPRVSTYLFYPTPTYVGQYVLFLVDVVDADGLGWGANVYTNNFYAIGSASGTVSGNQLQAIIIGGFYTTAGINLGTFYLSGIGVVQTQVNL